MAQPMNDAVVPRLPVHGRRRLFKPAAATLLDSEALGLRRGAVEAALAGDMLAIKLCLEPELPRCHERPLTLSLLPLAAIDNGEIDKRTPQEVSLCSGRTKAGRLSHPIRRQFIFHLVDTERRSTNDKDRGSPVTGAPSPSSPPSPNLPA
jgi:hypothetical protein